MRKNCKNSKEIIINLICLAPRAGKMNQIARCDWLPERARWSHHSGLHAVSRKQNFPKSQIINPLLTKFVRSRWLDIGLVLFCEFMDLDSVSVHKHAKKELGQYPAILTSHLVNNPYIKEQGWRRLTWTSNDELEKFRLNFSRCPNRGIASLNIETKAYEQTQFLKPTPTKFSLLV